MPLFGACGAVKAMPAISLAVPETGRSAFLPMLDIPESRSQWKCPGRLASRSFWGNEPTAAKA